MHTKHYVFFIYITLQEIVQCTRCSQIYRIVGKGLKNMRTYYKNEPILWILYYFSIIIVL